MLFQSQISSICELQPFTDLKYEQFPVCYLPFSPKCTSVPLAEQTGPLVCGICIRISIAKVFSGLNDLIQIIQDSSHPSDPHTHLRVLAQEKRVNTKLR